MPHRSGTIRNNLRDFTSPSERLNALGIRRHASVAADIPRIRLSWNSLSRCPSTEDPNTSTPARHCCLALVDCCNTADTFRPRGFSPPRRVAPWTGLQVYCALQPVGVRRATPRQRQAEACHFRAALCATQEPRKDNSVGALARRTARRPVAGRSSRNNRAPRRTEMFRYTSSLPKKVGCSTIPQPPILPEGSASV